MRLVILDPSLATDNLGDEIIYQAVEREMLALFPNAFPLRIATHDPLSARSHEILNKADLVVVAGSNLLPPDGQWPLRLRDLLKVKTRFVIFGAGWQHDSSMLRRRSRMLLLGLLDKNAAHSVRDEAARRNLHALGFNVLNTSCPTLWRITPAACATIPAVRAPDAVVTVTAYRHQPEADRAFLKAVTDRYRKVWFFPQMDDDLPHVKQLGFSNLHPIAATTAEYTKLLTGEDIDYIGTRLHGGIRALQCGRRSLILQVDNRARDISAHIGFPSFPSNNLPEIINWIENPKHTLITLPEDEIARWKSQFSGGQGSELN